MISIRIVELPKMKVVTSGPIRTQEAFDAFNTWWSAYDKNVVDKIAPRDFMWFNEREQATEWFYALPIPETGDSYSGYEAKEFEFGMYAVASNLDADCDDAKDWLETKAAIENYVKDSEVFELSTLGNDNCERYAMFHIITPQHYFDRTGIHQEDMFVPIVYKKTK